MSNKYDLDKIHKVSVFMAAEAFLYLPIYAAKELGVFANHKLNVNISAPKDDNENTGDDVAITKLSKSKKLNFAIASAAPLLSEKSKALRDIENCRVIGGLISKLSYWALNHSSEKYSNLRDLVRPYKNIIHYDENFREGHYLGIRLREIKKNLEPILVTEFGNEFKILEDNNCSDDFTVSASLEDIVSQMEKNNTTSINYSFSQDEEIGENFLTTAIISRTISKDTLYEKVAIQFLMAIQKTILILYSSPTATRHCIVQISKKYNFDLLPSQKTKAMRIIRQEKFYKNDLNINLKSWVESMKALELSEWVNMEPYNKLDSALKIRKSYKELVDNSLAHKAEKVLANELGINKNTFLGITDHKAYKWILMYIGFVCISLSDFYVKIILSILLCLIISSVLFLSSIGNEIFNTLATILFSAAIAITFFGLNQWRNRTTK